MKSWENSAHRVSGLRKIWTIVFGIIVSLLALVSVTRALRPLFLPCGHGQLTFSNECAIPVEKAMVSFGKNTVVLNGIPPRGRSTEHFFVRDDCTCRVVVTLADGLVVSNSYGYYCYGMDCGTVDVTVTKDKRVKIVDMYYKGSVENKRESSKLMSEQHILNPVNPVNENQTERNAP